MPIEQMTIAQNAGNGPRVENVGTDPTAGSVAEIGETTTTVGIAADDMSATNDGTSPATRRLNRSKTATPPRIRTNPRSIVRPKSNHPKRNRIPKTRPPSGNRGDGDRDLKRPKKDLRTGLT
jgi:hypothetical protein